MYIVGGIARSPTSRRKRNHAIVGANEPMPSVSKKLVTAPSNNVSPDGRHGRPLAICLERQGATGESRRCWNEARDLYAALGIEPGVTECEAALARLQELPD